MDLIRHLRYFTVVADELHFGNAAARLGMAQPPLSQRIKRLEDELGVRLFDRSSRQVRLTEAGRLLLAEARDIVERVDAIPVLLARTGGDGGSLRVGVPADLGGSAIAALVAGFRAARPEVRLALIEMSTADQVAALTDGALDGGVIRHPVGAPSLRFGPVLVQHPGVLLPEDDPLAAFSSVHLADLGARHLVIFPREAEPGLHEETLADCRRHGYVPAEVHAGRHSQFTLGLVMSGTAVAFGPRADQTGVVWRPLLGDPLAWRVSMAWQRPSEAVEEFGEVVLRVLRENAGMVHEGAAPPRPVRPRPSSGLLA
ncbi:LysR family transcriptional regulator [Sphaerisporangium melleum]|uniref:LysR family transcriptional regulator n=1 Tax=Sphaerisporangium melleum TaxID=321316 RepID=A0A917QXN5_9ACTN|nr:LysR substrate-binding domain-containing protein [Sphaerisporangium melleum]GGK75468.1 LysR family transcriptional regulator [Sphaerisporangium melleum]GII72638.1 LysR family transcriptional regulator [Sphaerisporangium melleum]